MISQQLCFFNVILPKFCTLQESIQATYFSAPQVTVHTACIFYNITTRVSDEKGERDVLTTKCMNTIGVSSVVQHNSAMVYAVQRKLIDLVKQKLGNVAKIVYLSDGCAGQHKNKANFKNLCWHQENFKIDAEWHFFPTSHGKSPVDGIGGTFKLTASRASQRGTQIFSCEELYNWVINEQEKKDSWENFWFYELNKIKLGNCWNATLLKRYNSWADSYFLVILFVEESLK